MVLEVQVSNMKDGISGLEVLTIVFIALKLLGKITWSWWWVLSPIWITMIIVVIIFIVIPLIFK